MPTCSDYVLQVLRQVPQARDDDRVLMVEIYRQRGLNFTPEQLAIIYESESPASMARTRARLQNKHSMFKPSQEVQKARKQKRRSKPPRSDEIS